MKEPRIIQITQSQADQGISLIGYMNPTAVLFHKKGFYGTSTVRGCEIHSTQSVSGMVSDINELNFYDTVSKSPVIFEIIQEAK